VSAPFKGLITFVFEKIICSASRQLVEEQVALAANKTSVNVVKERVRRMSIDISNHVRRMSNILSTNTSQIATEARRLAANVRSTMIVDAEFILMRKRVAEILHTYARTEGISSISNNPTDNTKVDNTSSGSTMIITSSDTSVNDTDTATYNDTVVESDINNIDMMINDYCYDFVKAFTSYRDNLTMDDQLEFDRSWSFLYFQNGTTAKVAPHDSAASTTMVTPHDGATSTNKVTPHDSSIASTTNSLMYNDERFVLFVNVIYSEISSVYRDASKALGTIDNLPPHVQSAVLMRLFLVDLLGRDTLEAKIFSRNIEKEMKSVLVLPLTLKVTVFFLMVLLNFYFVFGSMLYAKNKSLEWQVTTKHTSQSHLNHYHYYYYYRYHHRY